MNDLPLISRKKGWLAAWVGPELVLMQGDTGAYISMSETAGRIWELLQSPQTMATLCDALNAEYAADPNTIRSEAETFLERMQAEGTIEFNAASLA